MIEKYSIKRNNHTCDLSFNAIRLRLDTTRHRITFINQKSCGYKKRAPITRGSF